VAMVARGWSGRVGPYAPALAASGVLLAGAVLCLALNWPGHFSWDSAVQLGEGRRGVYSGGHPPVMSWLLGIADRIHPGAVAFVVFDVTMIFGAFAALVWIGRPTAWLAAPLAAAIFALPQVMIYPAIVWKDVLYAGASIAGFASLAWAARLWVRPRWRYSLLALSVLFLVLASLTRQNGAVVIPFAALALGFIAVLSADRAPLRRAAVYGGVALALATALTMGATAALNTRLGGPMALTWAFRNLEAYDLVGAVKRDPHFQLGVLHAKAPWLETLLRGDGAANFSPSRIDPMQDTLDSLNDRPEATPLIAEQWRALVLGDPLLYLRGRGSAFRWVFLTPHPDACVMVETGVDGDDDDLAAAGLVERETPTDKALADYALSLDHTPLYSHAAYALVSAALLAWLFVRHRPADLAVAAMLLSALAFAASFALISFACDYRYLYDLDLSVIAGLVYVAATARGLLPQQRQRESRRRPRGQQFAAEAEEFGGAAAGFGVHAAEALDEVGALDDAAEVLLVQGDAADRLHGALQRREGEGLGHQFEDHRAVLQLAAQAAEARGEDAAVVGDHRRAEADGAGLGRRAALGAGAVAGRLRREAGLVEQLVALQNAFLVPGRAVHGEQQAHAGEAALRAAGPLGQRREDARVDDVGSPAPPVFPREEVEEWRPGGIGCAGLLGERGQRQVAYGDHPRHARADVGQRRLAALVAEGVELLDEAELEPGLAGNELAQRDLEGALALGVERAEGQALQRRERAVVARPHGQRHRLAVLQRDHHRREPDDDVGGHGPGSP